MEDVSLLTPDAVAARLESSLERGLTRAMAAERLQRNGSNKLVGRRRSSHWKMLWSQFTDLLALLLIVAGVLNLFLGGYRDAVILFTIVLVNAGIGFFQEFKAERVLEGLQRLLAPRARVVRDGVAADVSADTLVLGDLRLTEENNLLTNDFSLTGEADPKNKFVHVLGRAVSLPDRDNEVFFGTTVARGNGRGLVAATGMATEIGRIATLSEQAVDDLSPLQVEMNILARRITVIALIIGVVFFGLAFGFLSLYAAFVLAIGIAAACVPQGLPAQVSVALSLGVKRLAARNALVKKLSAVETLGSTTVICTDKTGTITAGQMTIQSCWTVQADIDVSGTGYEPAGDLHVRNGTIDAAQQQRFLRIGPLCSTADIRPPDADHASWYCLGDPTEGALLVVARKAGLDPDVLRHTYPEIRQFPFDSVRKRMSSVRTTPEGIRLFVKGAPDAVLAAVNDVVVGDTLQPMTDELRAQITARIAAAASEGLRVLALAERPLHTVPQTIEEAECELTLVGFTAMRDPARPGVAEALAATHTAGIRTFILTGDAAATAEAIAGKVGLAPDGQPLVVTEGQALLTMSDETLRGILAARAGIFCRVSPEDKLRIVNLLKAQGEIVAVTGDGVNDAPALKAAAIGVAMGRTGTDVSKGVAEVILLDDAFTTLVDAVREGRTIYHNLRKNVRSTLTANGGELFTTLFGFGVMAAGLQLPIFAVQILAIDLFAEMLPLALLTLDPGPEHLMHEPPRRRDAHLVAFSEIARIAYWGALMGGLAIVNYLLFIFLHTGSLSGIVAEGSLHLQATTVTYLTVVFCQYANILSRRWDESVFSRMTLSNPLLLGTMALTMAGIAIFIASPIGGFLHFAWPGALGWGIAFGAGCVYLGVWEIQKRGVRSQVLGVGTSGAMADG